MKNASLDASAAARTAENEPEEVYLKFPKGKAVPFENARECTSAIKGKGKGPKGGPKGGKSQPKGKGDIKASKGKGKGGDKGTKEKK